MVNYFLSNLIYRIYDRWSIVKNINRKYKLNKIETFSYKKNTFIPHDTEDFFSVMELSEWEAWIFSEIIVHQNLKHFQKRLIFKRKQNIRKGNLFKEKIKQIVSPASENKYFLKTYVFLKV